MSINNLMNSRWLLTLPALDGANLSLSARDATDCTLPGFDFTGGQISGGASTLFADLEPDKFIPEPIQYNFLVDEKLHNYLEVLKRAFSAYRNRGDSYFDCAITPLDGLGKDFGLSFEFTRTRISSISTMQFDNNASDKHMRCSVGLKYENMRVILNGSTIIDVENP